LEPPRRGTDALALLAWGAGPVLLARFPWAVAVLPALGVLRGPLGAVLLAVAAAAALVRLAGGERRRSPPGPWLLFLVALAAYVLTGLHYASRLQVSGDEPHYLLMAQSLGREGDLDLEDNFAREDWREYTPGPLAAHYGTPRRDGRPYPAHSPGLSLLLAPAYAGGGRPACIVLLALLAALVVVEARRLALRLTADPRAAFVAGAASAGPPLCFYAFHVYTEVPSALCLVASLNRLLAAPGAAGAGLAAFLAACLPWLHVKMIPAAAALGVVALVRLEGRARVAFVLVAGAMAVGYLGYYQHVFGRPTPLALYGGLPEDARSSPVAALVGLLLDRSFGLLPHAPVFLVALAGLGPLARRWRDAWPCLLVGAAVLAPVLTWRMWWGGQCPPGRFLVPLVPFLAAALAVRIAEPWPGIARWRSALLGLGLALAAFMVWDPARLLLLNRAGRPARVWAALSGEAPVARYLPSLTRPDANEVRVAGLWGLGIVLVLLLDGRARGRLRGEECYRGLALPVLLLLGIGVGVDAWGRAGPGRDEGRGRAPSALGAGNAEGRGAGGPRCPSSTDAGASGPSRAGCTGRRG